MIEILNNQIFYYFLLSAFCLLFSYLAWRDLRWGIYLICAFLPSYLIRFEIGFVPMTLLETMILIAFIIWLIKNYQLKSFSLNLSAYKWPILVLFITATISIFISPDLRAAAGIWKAYFVEPIIFFMIFINAIKTKKDLERVFWALGFLVLAIGIFAIWQKITGELIPVPMWRPKESRRVTTFFTSPNAISLLVGPIIILYFGWLLEKISNLKSSTLQSRASAEDGQISNLKSKYYQLLTIIYQLTVIILGILSLVFARSRASWIAVALAIIFILFFGWSKKWTTLIVASAIIVLVLVPISQNFLLSLATFKVPSGNTRLLLWEGTVSMLKDRPIFGAGLSGFWQIYQPYRLPQQTENLIYPHNIILNFWSEIGLLGLIAIIWIIAKFFQRGYNIVCCKSLVVSNKILTITLLAVMAEIIIHGLVDAPYFKNDLSVLFWLIIGMMVVVENLTKSKDCLKI
jgi:O-antigen ligase